MDNNITSNQQVLFNLGTDWNQKISRRVDAALENYLIGNITNWFFNLKAIKFLIISYLNKDERAMLEALEKEILTSQNNKLVYPAKVEQYDIYIKDFLKSKGFLNPMRDDTTNLYGQTIPQEDNEPEI